MTADESHNVVVRRRGTGPNLCALLVAAIGEAHLTAAGKALHD